MTRPAVACYCGTPPNRHAAIYAWGLARQHRITEFKAAHSGPGHLPEDPPRDWYGKEAALARRLRQLGRERHVVDIQAGERL
jgi:hypothetical protein